MSLKRRIETLEKSGGKKAEVKFIIGHVGEIYEADKASQDNDTITFVIGRGYISNKGYRRQ